MSEICRDEAGLKDFLVLTWARYTPEGSVEEVQNQDGSLTGTSISGSWKMVDTYHVNPAKTVFSGRGVVFNNDQAVWGASYHTAILDPALSAPILNFFSSHVVANPNPNFPVSAIQDTEDERFRFNYRSILPGQLTVARFVVRETIQEKRKRDTDAFVTHTMGGWIN